MRETLLIRNFLLVFVLVSCGQDFNSSSFDESKFLDVGIDVSTPEGQRFFKAYQLIDAKCTSCHNYHDQLSSYTTSDDWVAAGYVSPGDFTGSLLVQRLQFSGSNMPLGSSGLNTSEIDTLRDWIEGLTP